MGKTEEICLSENIKYLSEIVWNIDFFVRNSLSEIQQYEIFGNQCNKALSSTLSMTVQSWCSWSCIRNTKSKTEKSKGVGQLVPPGQLSQGMPRRFREPKKLALKVVGTGLENSFCDFQLFYIGKYRETAKIAHLAILTPLNGIFQAYFAP